MIKIGVIGVGHLGKIHLNNIKDIPDFEVVGFFDIDEATSKQVSETYSIPLVPVEELIKKCDAIVIATPTDSHFEYAEKSIRQSKHVFIEKPVTLTSEEAKKLVGLASEAQVVAQVGHVERFNPAFVGVKDFLRYPLFIESHRLAPFISRGTEVSVVLDLMVHDIDIVLSVVKSNVKKISASGVSVVSDTPDIASARIEFDNGCVANLTASRISMKKMRKTRFFQKDAYISVDFLEKKFEVIRLKEIATVPDPYASLVFDPGNGKMPKQVIIDKKTAENSNAILEEFKHFAHCIKTKSQPMVSVEDGYLALDIAQKILDKINLTTNILGEARQ